MQIEIEDGNDVIDIRATRYLKGDPTHPEALAFLAGERVLVATSIEAVAFVDESELVGFAAELIGRRE